MENGERGRAKMGCVMRRVESIVHRKEGLGGGQYEGRLKFVGSKFVGSKVPLYG